MYQGSDVENRNYKRFAYNPRDIDFVILTHAHLDHCGLLPKLYKYGFRGPVYMTPPTRYIVDFMLMDSAKIQEIRFQEHLKRKKLKGWALKQYDLTRIQINRPIYDSRDSIGILGQSKIVHFNEQFRPSKDVRFNFFRAGHALGAGSVYLEIEENGNVQRIVFSGDLGNRFQHLDSIREYPHQADFIIMESLYGGRFHTDRRTEESRFLTAIEGTIKNGGNVIIPAFTYQRSQEILYLLRRFIESGSLSKEIPVYFDSPLGLSITEGYKKFYQYLNPEIFKSVQHPEQLFSSKHFVFIKNSFESRRIRKRQGSIIIAGSGMCVGGRVLYHLTSNLQNKTSTILFVGFQAPDTLGREILDGAHEVSIDDKIIPVYANIISVDFSAHADHNDLIKWISYLKKEQVKKIFLVHAEKQCSLDLQKSLKRKGYNTTIPQWKKSYTLY
jgi:metallo-beta-lactamase family protein